MSTMTITLSTYNSANMHVNDVNTQYAEVDGYLSLGVSETQASRSLEPPLILLSQWPAEANSLQDWHINTMERGASSSGGPCLECQGKLLLILQPLVKQMY